MPKTGDECAVGGVYAGTCVCQRAIVVEKGERFPVCYVCMQSVEWELVTPRPSTADAVVPAEAPQSRKPPKRPR